MSRKHDMHHLLSTLPLGFEGIVLGIISLLGIVSRIGAQSYEELTSLYGRAGFGASESISTNR